MRKQQPTWSVEDWYISGVHTGWRVVLHQGKDLIIAGGFAYEDEEGHAIQRKAAQDLCDNMNTMWQELRRAIWLEVRWCREQYRYWPNRRFFAEQNANSIRKVWQVEGI